MHLHQCILVFTARVVFGKSFADERAHVRLLAALLVVVAAGERRLAESCDGEILFFGIAGKSDDVLAGLFEGRHGAFDGFDGPAGDAGDGCFACDWRDG